MVWKRLLFAVCSLALFLALVELALLATGVARLDEERDPFAGFSERTRIYRLDNDGAAYRTVPRAIVHSFHPQEFAARKPADGFRLFVLGGSSAFGFPWGAEVAFPRLLGLALQESLPGRHVESINAAAMSYGSHRLRILAHEILDYDPDAIVIYGGHNEFIERRFYRDLLERPQELDALRSVLYRWRLYSSLTRLVERSRTAAAPPEAPGERTTGELLGLDVVRENSIDVAETEREVVRTSFEENLRAIVAAATEAGVPVFLCTVPSNLRDWIPNQAMFGLSVPPAGRRRVLELLGNAERALDEERAGDARLALDGALEIAPHYAETEFLLGRALEQLGDSAAAARAFRSARDHDAQPSRAPTMINDAIRSVGRTTGAILVDVEQAFVDASSGSILGFNLFEDYVHPKPDGHRIIAREVWRAVLEHGPNGRPYAIDAGAFDRAVAATVAEFPRGGSEGPEAATAGANARQLFNLAIVLENQRLEEQAMEKYRAVLEREAGHHAARHNLARLLAGRGRLVEAEHEYRIALETARGQPMHASILIGFGDAVQGQGRPAEALALYAAATEIDDRFAPAWGRLGNALAETGRHTDADAAFRRALELDPTDAEALAGIGFSLFFRNRFDAALESFERALRLRPGHVRARCGLGATLTEKGEFERAEQIFRAVLLEQPDNTMASGGLELIARRRGAAH